MKTIKVALPFVLALLLGVVACDQLDIVQQPELGSANQDNYGRPDKVLVRSLPDDQRDVAFGLIGDTHIDASNAAFSSSRDTPRVKRNRIVINSLNIHLNKTANCHGIVHVGDMVDSNNTQNLVAFRQLYECGYPGHDGGAIAGVGDDHYHAYSGGYRVNKSVFPTLGNHDVPPYHDYDPNWHKPADYIRDLVKGADGIISYYKNDSGAYAWRWGQYYFIQLGQWAGSDGTQSDTHISYGKLTWLRDFLAKHVGDSGLGVLIFQHYGWDDDGSQDYWSREMKFLELDVLCRRDWNIPGGEPARPYNVLGIFTGHTHDPFHLQVFAGYDAQGEKVYFDNIVVDDAGAEKDHYGYSIVHLDGETMTIDTMNITTGEQYNWTRWTKSYHLGPQEDT